MRPIDTNVLVRLIARDNSQQVASAEAFIEHGAWVSILALTEAIWVLDTVYELNTEQLVIALEMLLEHTSLIIQDADVVQLALEGFRLQPSLGFSDCLMLQLARKAGHLPLGTFDRRLAEMEGTQRL